MTDRDTVRDQIAHAMGWTTGHFGDVVDAVMAVVDAVMAERNKAIAKLAMPCGSCHPCSNYSDETWRAACRKPPHVHEWDETRAVLGALRASHDGSALLPDDWEEQARLTAYAPDRMVALGELLDAWHAPVVRP